MSPRVRRVGWRLRLSGGSPPRPAAGAGRALVLVSEPDPAAARLSALLDALRREAGLEPALVALGDLPRFETRRVRRAIAEARRALRALHTSLRTTPALAATYVHRGVSFADLAAADLEVLLGAQLPAMVGFVESALELVESARPSALVLDVADPDERRALGTVARVAGLPWLAVAARETVQREPPERADAGPQPAATVDPGEPEHASAIARLLQAMRGSVGAP